MKKSVMLAIVFVAVVIGAVVYTTVAASSTKYRCEVCVEFQGRTACRTAAAATEMQARRTAQEDPELLRCWARLGNEIQILKVYEKLEEIEA